ncbi:hypothetical protein KL864_27160 [Mycolicibacterium goodii]|nr:hypothetical protein [Mycolicibacterium goodii]
MSAEDWFGQRAEEARRRREELRERALYSAVNLHCETGDSMAIFDRASVAKDVLATAEEFYAWIVQEETGDADTH